MISIKRTNLGVFAILSCVVIFIPVVQAQTPFDITECAAGTATMVYQSKECTIGGLEARVSFLATTRTGFSIIAHFKSSLSTKLWMVKEIG